MNHSAIYHALGDRDFFESPWSVASATTGHPIAPDVPTTPRGWERRSDGPWVSFRPPHEARRALPAAGWKVHVSVTPQRAEHVVAVVAQECFDLGVVWKVLATRGLVAMTQNKYAPRESSGKVCTVYPHDEVALEAVLRRLSHRLAGEPGPAVVGDVADPGSPVSLRWGAFRSGWLRAADGSAVAAMQQPDGGASPDLRIGAVLPPAQPHCVRAWVERAAAHDRDTALDVTDVAVVNRTNAGAIYTARYRGRTVVLKEARAHSGLTSDGSDATTRLRHEADVLHRLWGEGLAPEPIDYLRLGGSEFLVMEALVGQMLSHRVTRAHPSTCTREPGGPIDYYGWADRVDLELRAMVERLHELGVVHRDLHPANVIVLDSGALRLIDFECAALDGRQASTAGGAPGFTFAVDGPARDVAACDRLALMMRNPVVMVLDRRPDLLPRLQQAGDDDRAFVLEATPPQAATAGPSRTALLAGIRSTATPLRRDRLHPGSLEQLTVPGGGLGLWTGAAGVTGLMHLLHADLPAVQRNWLADQPVEALAAHRGLAHGSDGVALALARAGFTDQAAEVVAASRRLGSLMVVGPSWGYGHAGVAAALSELASVLDQPELCAEAEQHVRAAITAVTELNPAAPGRPGLLHGLAGTALALLRVRQAPWAGSLAGIIEDAVDRCVELELRHCVEHDGLLLGADPRGLLPYLGNGSAALGLVIDHLTWRTGDAALQRAREAILRVLRQPTLAAAGLGEGRAGILLTLEALAPDDPMVGVHRDRLGWHVAARTAGPDDEQFVLGEMNHRLSTDVASGSAGVLAALAGPQVYRELLLLPHLDEPGAPSDRSRAVLTHS